MSEAPASRLRTTVAFLMVAVYAALVYGSSSQEAPEAITDLEVPDYVLHAIEYGILAFLVSRWLYLWTGRPGVVWIVLLPALLATLYGITDEIHQGFVPERDGSVRDVVADAAGSLLGATMYWLFARLTRGRRSPSS